MWPLESVTMGGSYGNFRMRLWLSHCATFVYEGVTTHVRGSEGFSVKVRNPFTELIMKRRDGAHAPKYSTIDETIELFFILSVASSY